MNFKTKHKNSKIIFFCMNITYITHNRKLEINKLANYVSLDSFLLLPFDDLCPGGAVHAEPGV